MTFYLFIMTLGTRGPSLNIIAFYTMAQCERVGRDWAYEVNRDRASTNLVRWKCYAKGETDDRNPR